MALSQAGDVYTWGMNYLGQLGLLDTVQRLVPVKVRKSQPGQLFIAFIAAGKLKFRSLCFFGSSSFCLWSTRFVTITDCRSLSYSHD